MAATSAPEQDLEPSSVGLIEPDHDETQSIAESSTASIGSSILRYRQENGRTYHAYKDGQYILPNDQPEQERLDLQHHLTLLTFNNQLYISPAGRDGGLELKNVLDVGTGTGVWALDFADEHPETHVVGVDLSPIQASFTPPNVTFQIDDLEEPWSFGTKFDFVFSRFMTSSFADWQRFFDQSFANLNPGGWFEMVEICSPKSDDGTLKKDGPLSHWVQLFIEGTEKCGRSFAAYEHFEEQVKKAGFVNVKTIIYKWPTNRWPRDPRHKEIGGWSCENITSGLNALSAAVFTRFLGWSVQEMNELLKGVDRDLRDPNIHAYWPIMVIYGQKPNN